MKKPTSLHQVGLMFLSIFTAFIALAIAIYYAKQPILEFHGYRQTQTAITSYWMLREGWRLDYQTPVAGYPWSIPFEFPIYQSIVALIAYLGNFPLDPVGRFVSLAFLFASAFPAFAISRRLGLPAETPWVFTSLLWSSPLYLFWGRTFMIETAATFFTFSAIPYAIDLFDEQPRWNSALWFMFWMTLGMLQKITTALPVFIVVSALLAIIHLKNMGLCLPNKRKFAQIAVAFAMPIIIGILWAQYADTVKQENILGIEMTSKMLTAWNFGFLQQRWNTEIFKSIIWDRVFLRNGAGIFGAFILGLSLSSDSRLTKVLVITSLALFLLPIEIFINLHYVHDYYQTSCLLFLLGGLSIAIVDLQQRAKKIRIELIVTLVFVLFNLYVYKLTYWTLINNTANSSNKYTNQILAVSDVVNRYTPQDSVIVIFGMDWSSEIPYYAKRKALSVPNWKSRPDWQGKKDWNQKYNEIWQDPIRYTNGKEIGAIIFCTDENNQFGIKVNPKETLKNKIINAKPRLFKVANCYLWLPNTEKITLPSGEQVSQPISSLEE